MDVDGFCYKGDGNSYIIFYDDARTPKARINFTIAHELGHIALGHLKNVSMRPRYMTNRKNDPQEREADTFAGELIRPPIPFVFTGCTRIDDIQSVCNITYEAARSARSSFRRCRSDAISLTILVTFSFIMNSFSILSMPNTVDNAGTCLSVRMQNFARCAATTVYNGSMSGFH